MQPMRRALKIGWIVICAVALATALWTVDEEANRDVDILLTWAMIVLCFPSSLLTVVIVSGASYVWYQLLHSVGYNKHLEMIGSWLIFFTLGYIQWFIALPRIFPKRKMS
jgi:hypothetical protein